MIETLPESLICDYQYKMRDFVCEHDYCALWAQMGLGKTVATLMAIQELIDACEVHRTLIIAPLRVARKVWTDEIARWDHIRDFEVQKIIGTAKQRLKAMRTPAEIHLINRENVVWLTEQFIHEKQWSQKWPWDHVVLDESTSFSYQSSARWKALRRVLGKIDRMVQLTGTPDTRQLRSLWAQLFLLDRGKRLGTAEGDFLRRWFDAPNKYDPGNIYVPKEFAQKQIQGRIQDIVLPLQSKDYIKDFAEPRKNFITIELTKKEREIYKTMQRDYILRFKNDIIKAVNSGVLANKLLQLSNGFIYNQEHEWHSFHNQKIEALMELLEGLSGPVIIAYTYIPDKLRIMAALDKAKINNRLLRSEQDEDDWNAGEIDVLVISPQSAGHGLNIHYSGSENLIFFGLIWSLEQYQQTIARLAGGHRAGDRRNIIHHIVTENTYEDRVRTVMGKNMKNQQQMMDGLRDYIKCQR